MEATRINFSELGRVYAAIHIKPFGGITLFPARFKVDTGADNSTISKELLFQFGYDSNWIDAHLIHSGTTTTASGDAIKSGLVQLPLINFLGCEAKNWPFLVALDTNKDFRHLLGRDLLSGFNYTFNNDNNYFEIARAKEFKFILKKFPNQEIHTVDVN
ncbi:MAG: retroviral-like aspartic protease family protein [Defluviitaleaceae bacterium]|nr:retroviral-like aspartic protease family protein [Defluviitaleaceae bacterium]